MSNVVFILGAGCSKLAGAPLMTDFLDTASSLHSTGKVQEKSGHFERVFKAIGLLQAVLSKSQLDLINVESIFNAFEIANTIKKLPGHEAADIPQVLDSLKEVIVSTLENTIDFPVSNSSLGIPAPYESFMETLRNITTKASPSRTVSIITFNYDICIDVALFNSRLAYDYCIDQKVSTGIPLLKLHGSLNWASRISDNAIIPIDLKDYFRHYKIQFPGEHRTAKIPIGTQLSEYFSKYTEEKVNNEPVLIPPTWNKADHYSRINSVWSFAASVLGEAEYIFIIGYSLPETDAFFRLLYALGTVSDIPLKMIKIFNPDGSDAIRKRFESILGSSAKARYSYVPVEFRDSIDIISAIF